jgi:DNA mismatch endonuclease (patch repair protein)
MADIVAPEVRSRMMAGIRSKDTKPETILRSGLHRLGLRFRKNQKGLPGTPDMVFARFRAVVFAHGCFWHGHPCPLFKMPGTRTDFWRAKIERNKANDEAALAALRAAGWRVAIVWECATKGKAKTPPEELCAALAEWIRGEAPFLEISGNEGSAKA